MKWVEVLLQSGVLVSATALTMLFAACSVLKVTVSPALALVVGAGTLAVYGFDRLHDDRIPKPARAKFLLRARRPQLIGSCVAFIVAVSASSQLPLEPILLLSAVVILALLHAWLRKIPWFKPMYIASAWLLVVMGLPVVVFELQTMHVLTQLAAIGLAIVANVLACDACDGEAEARQIGVRGTWWMARIVAIAGIFAALVGSTPVLAILPAVLLLALVPMCATERYATLVLDGSLLVGAVLVIAMSSG